MYWPALGNNRPVEIPSEYSIWLLPAPTQEQSLAQTIAGLAEGQGGTVFEPHVTLQGDLAFPLENLSQLCETLAKLVVVQRWRIVRVENSEHFFRCLYLRFGNEPGFDALQGAAQAFTQTAKGLSPFPHLSLAYGQQSPEHVNAHASLSKTFAGQEITFDRLAVNLSSKNVPIAMWQSLAEYPLRQEA